MIYLISVLSMFASMATFIIWANTGFNDRQIFYIFLQCFIISIILLKLQFIQEQVKSNKEEISELKKSLSTQSQSTEDQINETPEKKFPQEDFTDKKTGD